MKVKYRRADLDAAQFDGVNVPDALPEDARKLCYLRGNILVLRTSSYVLCLDKGDYIVNDPLYRSRWHKYTSGQFERIFEIVDN